MKFKFHEIPPDGIEVVISNFSWFTAEEMKIGGDFNARAFLARWENRIKVRGQFCGTVTYNCDRCLENFSAPLDGQFDVFLEVEGGKPFAKEHECTEEELDTILLTESVVDLNALFQQQIYLTIPFKKLCSAMCKGLCSNCGKNLNVNFCNCPQSKDTTVFQNLANLKKSLC